MGCEEKQAKPPKEKKGGNPKGEAKAPKEGAKAGAQDAPTKGGPQQHQRGAGGAGAGAGSGGGAGGWGGHDHSRGYFRRPDPTMTLDVTMTVFVPAEEAKKAWELRHNVWGKHVSVATPVSRSLFTKGRGHIPALFSRSMRRVRPHTPDP
jgi:hypothetical protein